MADPEQSGASLLAESKHRRNYRIDLPEIRERVVVKEFLPPSRHRRSGRLHGLGVRLDADLSYGRNGTWESPGGWSSQARGRGGRMVRVL